MKEGGRERERTFRHEEGGRKERGRRGRTGERRVAHGKPPPLASTWLYLPLRSPDPWSKCSQPSRRSLAGVPSPPPPPPPPPPLRLGELGPRLIDSWASRVPARPRPAQPPPPPPEGQCSRVPRTESGRGRASGSLGPLLPALRGWCFCEGIWQGLCKAGYWALLRLPRTGTFSASVPLQSSLLHRP
ncbi:uncharacterized protein LOC128931694 isoform X1 [Callithrix jacchus]